MGPGRPRRALRGAARGPGGLRPARAARRAGGRPGDRGPAPGLLPRRRRRGPRGLAGPGRAPCPYSGPGRCGGCDWQHASRRRQRRLKASRGRGAAGPAGRGGPTSTCPSRSCPAGRCAGGAGPVRRRPQAGGGLAGTARTTCRPIDDCLIAAPAEESRLGAALARRGAVDVPWPRRGGDTTITTGAAGWTGAVQEVRPGGDLPEARRRARRRSGGPTGGSRAASGRCTRRPPSVLVTAVADLLRPARRRRCWTCTRRRALRRSARAGDRPRGRVVCIESDEAACAAATPTWRSPQAERGRATWTPRGSAAPTRLARDRRGGPRPAAGGRGPAVSGCSRHRRAGGRRTSPAIRRARPGRGRLRRRRLPPGRVRGFDAFPMTAHVESRRPRPLLRCDLGRMGRSRPRIPPVAPTATVSVCPRGNTPRHHRQRRRVAARRGQHQLLADSPNASRVTPVRCSTSWAPRAGNWSAITPAAREPGVSSSSG